MILRPEQLDADELRCQVCIIGAGAAGITLALELGKRRLDVLLVAGGGYEQSEQDRRLYEGTANPPGSHEPLEQKRHRAFGGSTKRWGGRLVAYDPIDFESRPYVPLSGWPISYQDVACRFDEATALCEVVPDKYQWPASHDERDLPQTLGDGVIDASTRERWSTPTDFGTRYRDALSVMDSVRVLIDYHAVDLRLDDDFERIRAVRLVSRGGRRVHVSATLFVLAAGGIENARLLLASRSQIPAGVGNHNDMIGRCYMSHLFGAHGWLTLDGKHKPPFYRMRKDRHGAYHRRRFRFSDQAQRDLHVMNVVGFPFRPEVGDPRHRDAVLSLLYLAESLFQAPPDERPSWGLMGRHVANVVCNHPLAWASAVRQVWLRTREPRLPFILPYSSRALDTFYFQSEHAPNPESRLVLGEQTDEFGVPRIEARVRFSEIDFRTVREFYRQLDLGLRSARLGQLEYKEAKLDEYLMDVTTNFNSGSHQLGTTRMSADPKWGVVDRDCKVHSVRNLFISGGSVFATSGHANPTLTILALALRLADHLGGLFAPHAMPLAVGNSPLASTPLGGTSSE